VPSKDSIVGLSLRINRKDNRDYAYPAIDRDVCWLN
jgi:hypothetical protein